MKIRSPASLVDWSMKPLVRLTFSALQNLDMRNNNLKYITNRHPTILSLKRKLERGSAECEARPYKRMRRRSYHSLDDVTSKTVGEEENMSKDDCFVEKCSIVDIVIILKKYFSCLPQNLWNNFFYLAVKELNKVDSNCPDSTVEIKAFELLFCKKFSSFSTKQICYYLYEKCEKLIYERLRLCRGLKNLEIRYQMKPELQEIFLSSLCRLSHLSAVTLLPNNKQSMHAAIPILSKHCKSMEELIISYDSEFMSDLDSNISSLQSCTKLKKLILHSFGRGAEAQYIKVLLFKLRNLKYLVHRELPYAIFEVYLECCKDGSKFTLNLKTLLLAVHCKGVGSQLCYLPDDYIVQIAALCPSLSYLKLVKPSNLSLIGESIPSLVSLDIHDCEITKSFSRCSPNLSLKNVAALSLKNTEHIDYGCIVLISNCCPLLQEFEISHSNLFWSNDLQQASIKNPFPYLKKLTLLKVPNTEQTEPRFVNPHQLYVDKMLLRFFLSEAKLLQELYLEFDLEAVRCKDSSSIPGAEELTAVIGSCKELRELMLLSCPIVSYKMMNSLIERCPQLQHLWDVDLWQIPSNEMDKILRKFSYMFIQSYERAKF